MPQIRCLISLRVESSIISIYSNIVENIIRKFIDVKRKKCRTQNGALRNTSINWIFLWRIPIQIHLKSSITELRRNKAKYLARNSIRLNFAKTTSMLNPVKSIRCIKCYSWSSPKSFKIPSNSIRYKCQRICSWLIRPETILKIRGKSHISLGDQQVYYLHVFQRLY